MLCSYIDFSPPWGPREGRGDVAILIVDAYLVEFNVCNEDSLDWTVYNETLMASSKQNGYVSMHRQCGLRPSWFDGTHLFLCPTLYLCKVAKNHFVSGGHNGHEGQ